MAIPMIERPEPAEYPDYVARYLRLVPDGDVIELLASQMEETAGLLGGISDEKALFRYAPGKWSIKEVVGHVIDSERIFAYRALCFSRQDSTRLPGFDQDQYVPAGRFEARRLADLSRELRLVRQATIAFFAGLDAEMLLRRGTANERTHSVRSIAWIIAGHELHHMDVVRKRYLYTAGISDSLPPAAG